MRFWDSRVHHTNVRVFLEIKVLDFLTNMYVVVLKQHILVEKSEKVEFIRTPTLLCEKSHFCVRILKI